MGSLDLFSSFVSVRRASTLRKRVLAQHVVFSWGALFGMRFLQVNLGADGHACRFALGMSCFSWRQGQLVCLSTAMSESNDTLILRAKELADEKRFEESVKIFSEIFEKNPNDVSGLRGLAALMSELGQVDLTLALLADSVDFENPDIPTLHQISVLLRGEERFDEAADILLCACAHDPQNQGLFEETLALLKQVGREAELIQEPGVVSEE
jgi:tetratricopeptide (TPR) repeat protein